MKTFLLCLAMLMTIQVYFAIEMDYTGNAYSRFIMHNNADGNDGNWFENKIAFSFLPKMTDNLSMVWTLQVYNVAWGDTTTVTEGTNSIDIQNYEMYVNYLSESLKGICFKIGKQYWADRRSLIYDDAFWAVIASNEDFYGLKTQLGGVQWLEKDKYDRDDYFIGLADVALSKENYTAGLFAMVGDNQADSLSNVTLMPYTNFDLGCVNCDLTLVGDYQRPYRGDITYGWAGALKTTADLGKCTLGIDVLTASKNGITTVYPYYINGLYIFGYGAKHDAGGFGQWCDENWNPRYGYHNGKGLFSGVLFGDYKFIENWKLFGAGGIVTAEVKKFDRTGIQAQMYGMEGNLGIEYTVVPEKMNISVFGALGQSGDLLPTYDDLLFQGGANLSVSF